MKAASLLIAAALLATPAVAKESLEQRLDRLEAQNRYLTDYIAIEKVQSRYQHYMNIGAMQAITGLFADSPDVEIELSNKDVLRGRDAPLRYFTRGATTDTPRPAGALIFHTAVNPTIEIDKKGERAKAVWLSPGITTLPAGEGRFSGGWNYGKYEMDYVKQKGEWKILHFRWHQIFLTPYDQGWTKQNLDPGGTRLKPDRPSAPDFYAPYSTTKPNRFDPPPPKPYED